MRDRVHGGARGRPRSPLRFPLRGLKNSLPEEGEIHVDPPRPTSIERIASRTIGTSRLAAAVARDLERLARRQRQHPPHLPHAPVAVDDRAALELVRPVLARLERRRALGRHGELRAAQRLGRLAPAWPASRRIGRSACPRGARSAPDAPSTQELVAPRRAAARRGA